MELHKLVYELQIFHGWREVLIQANGKIYTIGLIYKRDKDIIIKAKIDDKWEEDPNNKLVIVNPTK